MRRSVKDQDDSNLAALCNSSHYSGSNIAFCLSSGTGTRTGTHARLFYAGGFDPLNVQTSRMEIIEPHSAYVCLLKQEVCSRR